YNIQGAENKVVFRHAANRTLPDAWANRPKKGFPVPIRHWLRDETYYRQVRDLFAATAAQEFFDQKKLLKLLDDHHAGRAQNGRKIWTVYTFLVWRQRFFEQEAG
ncbi:MAG: asparagine synthase-related protein, partial [Oscillospiraceae bacterium]